MQSEVRLSVEADRVSAFTQTYTLSHVLGSDVVILESHAISQEFLITSSCDTVDEYDLNQSLQQCEYSELVDGIRFQFRCQSTAWKKVFTFTARPGYVEYYYELEGQGAITDLHYFQGICADNFEEDCYLTKHFNDKLRTPYKEYSKRSKVAFSHVFNPEPNSYNRQVFDFFERSLIGVNSDLDYCGGNFVANPGILCFALRSEDQWFTLGLAPEPGQYTFSEFAFDGGTHFGTTLSYWGATSVNGSFRTPSIIITIAGNEKEAVGKYIAILREENRIRENQRQPAHRWWYHPIVCGWGYQSNLGDLFRVRSQRPPDESVYNACTQENYEGLVRMLDALGLPWGTLIIDSRWFLKDKLLTPDAEKWPDLRGFVDRLHDRGKRVLIWWGPWAIGGFDQSELIYFRSPRSFRLWNRPGRFAKFGGMTDGSPVGPDVTIPSARNKIQAALRRLLSPETGCYNLDGLKIDHVASTPALFEMEFPEGSARICGIELLRTYLDLVYDSAKSTKEDALVIGQSPNPYFSNCQDMLRLGDIYSSKTHSVLREMVFRKEMANLACPTWLIDCDGWPLPSMVALAEYMKEQPSIGVPSFYYGTELDTTGETIPEDVLEELRSKWIGYVDGLVERR